LKNFETFFNLVLPPANFAQRLTQKINGKDSSQRALTLALKIRSLALKVIDSSGACVMPLRRFFYGPFP
jgi:hypothetical protein